MEQFSLEKHLENPSRKVVTRDGRSVNIIYDHMKGLAPIIALIQWNENDEHCFMYNSKGRCASNEATLDLFFADEEELTEFEKAVRNILVRYISNVDDFPETIKNEAKSLLDLARKELKSELDKKLKEAYNQGGLDTQEEITKCLPKWKKIPHGISRKELLDMMHKHIVLAFNDCVDYYYLDESDLRKLPKEE